MKDLTLICRVPSLNPKHDQMNTKTYLVCVTNIVATWMHTCGNIHMAVWWVFFPVHAVAHTLFYVMGAVVHTCIMCVRYKDVAGAGGASAKGDGAVPAGLHAVFALPRIHPP